MEEHQPKPHHSQRKTSQLPLPLEATPIQTKRSHLTESSTSRNLGSSYGLPKTFVLVATKILVTPTIFGTYGPKK